MPELTVPIRRHGAMLKILLRGRTDHRPEGRWSANRPVVSEPLPAYLDSGASDTMFDMGVIRKLGLQPVSSAALNVLGREEVSFHDSYEIEVAPVLADGAFHWFPLMALGGPVFRTGAVAALGRDFLGSVIFTYDGPNRRATISWGRR